MFGLEGAVGVFGHLHLHAELQRTSQRLDQDQLSGLTVRALHHEHAAAVTSACDAKAKAVRTRPPRSRRGGHAEQRGGGAQVGRQRQVVVRNGLRGERTGAGLHGTGIPFTLAVVEGKTSTSHHSLCLNTTLIRSTHTQSQELIPLITFKEL